MPNAGVVYIVCTNYPQRNFSLKASNLKDYGAIRDWLEPIRNHFWFCCQQAGGDLPTLKVMFGTNSAVYYAFGSDNYMHKANILARILILGVGFCVRF